MTRLLPLRAVGGAAEPTGAAEQGAVPARAAQQRTAGQAPLARFVGAKAARLAEAAATGLPVLPGWMVPVAESRPALAAGAAELNAGRPAAARRAVLEYPLDDELAAALRWVVAGLGGRIIVRSSSPLESDPRWSGAFSSVAEVGEADAVRAVRSCWASAFAVDPLARLAAYDLPPEALELGVLLQPELQPAAGGVARVTTCSGGGSEVVVEGVPGHPGALLAGWADGASARVALRSGDCHDDGLAGMLGSETVRAVADLAGRVWQSLGDDVIEWAAEDDGIWLLQCLRSGAATPEGDQTAAAPVIPGVDLPPGSGLPGSRAWMPVLAATVRDRGEHVRGRPAAPGTAAGRLLACRPHERPPGDCADAILLVDKPVPALAPLLFSARGVIARTGAAGSHLAEVARSLGIPMVTGCRLPGSGHAAGGWLAAVDGSTGDVALLPAQAR